MKSNRSYWQAFARIAITIVTPPPPNAKAYLIHENLYLFLVYLHFKLCDFIVIIVQSINLYNRIVSCMNGKSRNKLTFCLCKIIHFAIAYLYGSYSYAEAIIEYWQGTIFMITCSHVISVIMLGRQATFFNRGWYFMYVQCAL